MPFGKRWQHYQLYHSKNPHVKRVLSLLGQLCAKKVDEKELIKCVRYPYNGAINTEDLNYHFFKAVYQKHLHDTNPWANTSVTHGERYTRRDQRFNALSPSLR